MTVAQILLLLPVVVDGFRAKRRGQHPASMISDESPEARVVPAYDDTMIPVTNGTPSVQWAPCTLGMCYESWGAYNKGNPGVGGLGNRGCKRVFGGCKNGGDGMDCAFGPCPKYFGSPRCVSVSECRSYCDLQHAGTCRYTGPVDDAKYSGWMAEFSDVPLNKLLMVEAHHVLARLGTLDFKVPVTSREEILGQIKLFLSVPGLGDIMRVAYASLLPMYSSCQSEDVATLLARGVRGVDLRPYLSKGDNKLHDYHGGRGPLIEDAIAEVGRFARDHRSEIIFVNLQNIYTYSEGGECMDCSSTGDVRQVLLDALQRHFGNCGGGLLLCDVDVTRSVGALAALGNVVMFSNDQELIERGPPKAIHSSISSSRLYNAPWYNTNSLSTLTQRLLQDSNARQAAQRESLMVGHQWVMTPNDKDYIGSISQRFTGEWQDQANRDGCQSLACMAEVASAESFEQIFPQVRTAYPRSNFLMLDFADRKGTMDVVLRLNRRYARS